MSFIIKGIDLPKEDEVMVITVWGDDRDGTAFISNKEPYNVVPINAAQIFKKHGRLIDSKEILARAKQEVDGLVISAEHLPMVVEWILDKCDTILEAEE